MSKMTKKDARRIVSGPKRTPVYCVLSIKDLRGMIAHIQATCRPNPTDPEITCESFQGNSHKDLSGKYQVQLGGAR